ncbi:MAG: hypothetical protein WBC85_08030, partial [Planktotalea sp.]|uniref:hypothetical protein n=1 Tax=Planktotalea sp. TaxID=2029877 RepID=UPI003C70D812
DFVYVHRALMRRVGKRVKSTPQRIGVALLKLEAKPQGFAPPIHVISLSSAWANALSVTGPLTQDQQRATIRLTKTTPIGD